MNLHAVVLAPWRACRPAMRWMALVMATLFLLGAIAVAIFSRAPDGWLISIVIISFGEGFLWAFIFSTMALLAVDAHQMRLPGVERSIALALLLYGLLTVMLPAGLFGLYSGHMLVSATLLTLSGLCGLLFALLPRFLSALMGFMPMTLQALPMSFHLAGPSHPGFIHWAIPATLAMLLIALFCWRRLLRAINPYEAGLSAPMVLQFRNPTSRGGCNAWNGFAGGGVDNARQIRNRPDWMQPQADLRGCGPGHAVHSLRIALGGMFVPLTPIGRLRQLAFVLVPSLLFIVLMSLSNVHEHVIRTWMTVWHDIGLLMLTWIGAFGSVVLTISLLAPLQQRWQKVNAELPLLALLPGLHDARRVKRDLLRAILLLPLCVQIGLMLVVLALASGRHLSMASTVLLLLSQLGNIGFMFAFALSTVGGRPLPHWGTGLLAAFGYALVSVSIFLPTFSNTVAFVLGDFWLALLAAAWAALIVMLLWLSHRGWRGLQQRPHPFLPN